MTGRRLTELSFEDWIEHVFSHEVPTYHAAWYFDVEADWWDGPPALTISYITRLFSDPDPPLTYFADSQIAQGLTYLIDCGAGDQMSALSQVSVPLEVRITCVESINGLFGKLFDPRCSPHLAHLDEPDRGALNDVCYMWWDTFPFAPLFEGPDFREIEQAALGVMERSLELECPACHESALHGLGHWLQADPGRVEAIIDRFLKKNADLRPELAAYARSARSGCVL